jgi:hypothetical protein
MTPTPGNIDNGRPIVDDRLAQAYRYLQRVVGLIALALPFGVSIGDRVIADQPLRGSISAYYYGSTGSYFVGSLCALAVFFLSYQYEKPPRPGYAIDRTASNILSAFAVGVALLPTAAEGEAARGASAVIATLHLVCAGCLFVLLAYFSLCRFTRTAGDSDQFDLRTELQRCLKSPPALVAGMSERKRRRNAIYRACGWIIVACIAMVGISNALHWHILFWLESVAIVAFGMSWLVKSDSIAFLRDASDA